MKAAGSNKVVCWRETVTDIQRVSADGTVALQKYPTTFLYIIGADFTLPSGKKVEKKDVYSFFSCEQ